MKQMVQKTIETSVFLTVQLKLNFNRMSSLKRGVIVIFNNCFLFILNVIIVNPINGTLQLNVSTSLRWHFIVYGLHFIQKMLLIKQMANKVAPFCD